MKKKDRKALKHVAGMFDDLAFFYKVTSDLPRSKGLKKVARKLRKKAR